MKGGRGAWGTQKLNRARGTTHITAQVSLAWFPRPSAGAVPDGWRGLASRVVGGGEGVEEHAASLRWPRNTVHTRGLATSRAGGQTNEVTRGEKQFRQFGRSWRCTITEDITNSWMRARQ